MTAPPGTGPFGDPGPRSPCTWSGIGGAGMSAIATALHAMGHTVTGSDLRRRRSPSGSRGRDRRWPSATPPPTWGRPTWSPCPPPSPRQPGGGRGEAPRDHRAGPGRGTGLHRLPQALHRRGRHPREDDHRLDARPPARRGGHPGRRSSSAATSTRSAPTRSGTRASGWWSRPTRATARSCRSCRTSPWSPMSRRTISTTTGRSGPCGRLSRISWPVPAATGWWEATIRWRRRSGGTAGPTWWVRDPSPPTGSSISTLARSSISFRLVGPDGVELGRLAVPVPGLHNARNAAVATVAALAAGVPFDAAARALARFAGVARRFEFRGERSTG